jgi:hypothetical protein
MESVFGVCPFPLKVLLLELLVVVAFFLSLELLLELLTVVASLGEEISLELLLVDLILLSA